MLSAASRALSEIFSPPFRKVMWKSLGLTIGILIILWLALQNVLGWLIEVSAYPWLDTTIAILTGVGLFVGLAFLIAPITALVAGILTDEIANQVEKTHYPDDPPGRDLSVGESLVDAISFTGVVILVNLVALALLLVPGVNLIIFFVANGYLLGREYFEAAARRFMGRREARAFRRDNSGTVFMGGLLIALFLAIPILNLFTPLFAMAFAVHLFKRVEAKHLARTA